VLNASVTSIPVDLDFCSTLLAADPVRDLFHARRDVNLARIVAETRIKSSFIYLANAVRDLTGNWRVFAVVLAPAALLASLCLLPDALNLQHSLVEVIEPGTRSVGWHNVAWHLAQTPYPAPPEAKPYFPRWATLSLHLLFLVIIAGANLLVLAALKWILQGAPERTALGAARHIFRDSYRLLPSFAWIALLQLVAIGVGFVLLIVPGFLAFVWLYFAQYALVLDGYRSWPALLYSRELMRKRFFQVAIRIVVFLAVWSGFNSWAGGLFVALSLLMGLLGAITGALWAGVFILEMISVIVALATSTFFFAAGVRLYQDLKASAPRPSVLSADVSLLPTGPLESFAQQ